MFLIIKQIIKMEIFSKIINENTATLLNGASPNGKQTLSNCKLDNWKFVKGLSSSSAGVNDIYVVKSKKGDITGIMKTHIGRVNINVTGPTINKKVVAHENDIVEEMVYNLTTNFVIEGMSPNFVMKLDSGHGCKFENLCTLLGDSKKCTEDLKNRIIRNYMYMFCKSGGRPSITTNGKIPNQLFDWCRTTLTDKTIINIGGNYYEDDGEELDRIKRGALIERTGNGDLKMIFDRLITFNATYGYIVLETINAKTLDDYNLKSLSDKEFWSLVFILMYNITLLSSHGVSHNDLHFGNIFMDDRRKDETDTMSYTFKNSDGKSITQYIKNPRGKVPRIFDYDRSSVYGHVNVSNKYNTFSNSRDAVQLFSGLIARSNNSLLGDAFLKYPQDINMFRDKSQFTARDKDGTTQGIEFEMNKLQVRVETNEDILQNIYFILDDIDGRTQRESFKSLDKKQQKDNSFEIK